MIGNRFSLRILLLLAFGGFAATAATCDATQMGNKGIQIYQDNPRYWQYKGEPVLLLGGSGDDNLFQWTGSRLTDHLDLLVSVGGNYLRNTMSDRKGDPAHRQSQGGNHPRNTMSDMDEGEVYPFKELPSGKYDLNQWNEEYWRRFETFLKSTHERDIIVQIEVWDRFDYGDASGLNNWIPHPYNPANNVNYSTAESGLATTYPNHPGVGEQPFFHTVPGMKDNTVVRKYQEAFVDKMLSHSLPYGNVLYCMNNETSTPPVWGQYWMARIRKRAAEAGVGVWVTDMFDVGWNLDTDAKFLMAFDTPELYSFLDISQNNGNPNTVEKHWRNILFVHDRIKNHPRPINNVKVYGADEYPPQSAWHKKVYRRWGTQSGVRSFVMNVLGGCASSRFHRNHSNGLGLTEPAQAALKAIRKLESLVKMWEVNPHNISLSGHNADGVFLAAKPGEKYAIYFVDGGSAVLNLSGDSDDYRIRWISVDTGQWGQEGSVPGGGRVTVSAPGTGGWIAAIVK